MPGLTLDMQPAQAIEKINEHTNNGDVGKPVGTDGIEDNAVTEPKMANESVSARTIQPGAVTMDTLDTEVKDMISAGGSEGVPGLTNFIAEGLKLTPGTGLDISVQPGRASISEKTLKLTTLINLALGPRMASIIYAQKQTDNDAPTIGKVDAVLPEPDDNTVAQWRFNLNGDVQVPNYAVGKSAIAIANNLVPNGGLARVDGYTDYAVKGDGSTGYYVSQNSTGFPSGGNERQLDILFTVNSVTGNQIIGGYGVTQGYFMQLQGSRLYFQYISGAVDTGYDVEIGKTYLISFATDITTSMFTCYINGIIVYKITSTPTTTATVLNVLRYTDGAQKSSATLHAIELRNKIRTPQQIAQIANNLLLPCQYQQQYLEEYINGTKYYDIATQDNAISGGDASGFPKSNAYNKDNIVSTWYSLQSGTGVNGVSYIGQKVSTPIKKMRHTNFSTVAANASSIKLRWSYDLISWNDIQTQALPTTANTVTDYDVADYSAVGVHFIAEFANSAFGSSQVWAVSEINMYTNLKPTEHIDIRDIFPADAISLGTARTDSTKVIEYNDTDYKYGRREGATGGNRKKLIEWKYVTTGIIKDFANPFGTENVSVKEIWYKKNLLDSKHSVIATIWSSGTLGCFVHKVTSEYISIKTGDAYVIPFAYTGATGTHETSGYIAIIAEVIE